MPYQDFLQRLRAQQQSQPIVLPDYDLPTQVDPVDPVKSSVEKIFGRPSADKTVQAVVEPEKAPLTTGGKPQKYRTLGEFLAKETKPKPRKRVVTQTRRGVEPETVVAQSAGAFGQQMSGESSFAARMNFRGPSEVEKMADRAIAAGGQQYVAPRGKNLGADFGSWLREDAKSRRQKETETQAMLEGVDTGQTKLDPTALGKEYRKARTKKEVAQMSPLHRMVTRVLARSGGASEADIAETMAPQGFVEQAGSAFAGSAIRGAASIPEGIVRLLDQQLNRPEIETARLYEEMLKNNPDMPAEDRAWLEGKIKDKYAGLSNVGDYLEPITKAGEAFTKTVIPTDPAKKGSINPLERGFWETTLPETGGSMLPFFVGGGLAGSAGIPARLAAGTLGAAMEIPEGYHEARAAGATPEQLSRTVDTRTVAGALEMFGAESLMGNIAKKFGKSLPSHFAKEAGEEFGQEFAQSATSDLGDKYYAKTKPELTFGQMTERALSQAVPALFLGAGGAGLSVPQHLAEKRGRLVTKEIADQIETLAVEQPEHPLVQALESSGIDPKTITQADERAVEELSVRLQAMAKMDSQIQQIQGSRDLLAQQAQNAQDAQLMGRVPATADGQAVEQLPVVEQQLAEAVQAKEAVGQDIQQNVSPLFRNLAKAVGQSGAQPLIDVDSGQEGNLLTEIRKAGGMSAAEGQVEKGELDRLSPKELETTGLISRKAGLSPDAMRERMVSEGLSEAETAQDFIGEVEAAARRPKTESESYADYQRGQMTEEEQADSDNLDALLEDRGHPFTQAYRALDNPKTIYSPKLARDFVSAAEKAGFSGDFIERSLVEFQRQRGIGGQGAMEPDFAEKPGRSMKTSQPGIAPSLSPYKVLEANNKDLLKRLYDVNLNSNEGKQGIQALRDYARQNGIEQRHVNAHIADIQNWQGKYGVPKNPNLQQNPDLQQSQTTRTEPLVKEKAPQSARSERPTPKSGFSLEQRKMLGREVESLADDEFDEYLGELEKIQAQTIKGAEFGGFDISEGERKGLATKMRQTRGERHKRVKAGRLKALFPAKQGVKQPSKAKLSEEARKTVAGNRETESVPRETEKVSQPQVGDYWNFTEPAIGYKAGKPFTYQQTLRGRVEKINPDGTVELRQQRGGFVTKHPSDLFIKGEKSQAEPVETAKKRIDEAAHEAATSPKNDLPEPTQAQKEAGNYQKGHINLHGLDITIENPEGSVRSGVGEDGKKWEVEMDAHYGYIRRTEGADEEQIDVYVGSKLDSNKVFVVDQIDPETGEFDEHKVILGAKTQAEAEKLYDAHFDDKSGPDRRGAVTEMSVDEFKSWLKNEDNTKPVGEIEEKAELIPLPKKNSIKRIDGVLHSSVDAERVGELNFELWENESYGGMTMVTRDAESGDALPGSVISDTNADRAKRRFKEKVETARQALGERSDEQVATAKPIVSGETSGEAVAETSAVAKGDERGMLRTPEVAADVKNEGEQDERFVDSGRLFESGSVPDSGRSLESGEQVASEGEAVPPTKSRPSVGRPGRKRKLRTETAPSLFSDITESEAQPSSSAELVEQVEAQTEASAASEAVIQAATADLQAVAETVEPESKPESKPKTPKPKPQPLSILTGASFTFTPETIDRIQSGGAVTKYRQNMDAIKTMRQILLEGRRATSEEQETLALYAGFGGIKDLFAASNYSQYQDHKERQKWLERQKELKELIGEEAFKAASKSTMNAHYTDPRIVQAMWTMAERLGFEKGRVLEPSMGSGNFLGLIPAHLRDKTTFTGVELDQTTGQIARQLYPDANIHVQGFEDFKAPDNFFDLAIGNVPFGDYRISDNRYNRLLPQIHNYFFLKALDKVRPGGLLMFISSTGTMDSRRAEPIRKELAKQADLVGAIRFPAETFGKTALTSVVTDLVILRKRLPGEAAGSDAWIKSNEVDDPRGTGYPKIRLNDYFAQNQSQMLGNFNGENRMYPGRANVDRTEDFEQRLTDAIAGLPAGVMTDWVRSVQAQMREAGTKAKNGGYVIKDGLLLQNAKDGLVEVNATPDRVRRIEGMLAIRDAFDKLIDAEMGRVPLGTSRKDLNSAYDKFHAKYGAISDKKNREALEGDPDLHRLMALEDYDPKKKIAKKQPIFTKATVSGIRAEAKPTNIQEAVTKSFQMRGELILSQMADDLGLDEQTVAEELVTKKIGFQTPQGSWELAAHYLSGNVRRKLAEAKVAAASDPAFQANVDALENVMPRDVSHQEVSVEMGAPWMEPDVISRFVAELFEDDPANVKIHYDRNLGSFITSLDRSRAKSSRLATTTWGTDQLPFAELLDLALSGKQAQVYDTIKTAMGTERRFNAQATQAAATKLDAIKQRFREWVWENEERRTNLLNRYNDLFNSQVPAEYNVDFMLDEDGRGVVPGLASGWKLRGHQMAAVFRAVVEKRGLLAHEVGLGKTLAMIASASELKRMGIARKPAIAVPKKVLPAFAQTVRDAFPLLKLHVVDSRSAEKRNTSMSQTATGDYDLVLMTHDNMDMLKMKPEFEAKILQQELDEVNAVYNALRSEKGSDKKLLSQIEKRREKLSAKINDALKSERKDDSISFEDTGIDFLFVDEFHKYKSLPVVTALGQVKGVPTGDSQRAVNMLMKARYLQGIQNGGGLIGATGTPVSNSLVEAWIMAKFLQPDLLEESGVQSFDAWTRQFAEVVPALEMTATGEWKQVSRLSKFRNLPELQTQSRMTLDVKTAKETGILDVRPKRIDKVIQVPQSTAQKAYMQVLRERAEAIKRKAVEPWQDNYLVVSSDGMLMASDPRLVLPGFKEEGGKIGALADNVERIYKDNPGTTQMIFSDSGVSPNAWGFHLYGEITNKLVERGIPRDKIIDFSKLDSDAKVEKAMDRLNSGDAVIAIGHRENMGTGVNAQQKMAAIHQFDVPWKPALVEQSEARGWRQGNENKEIEILSYVTEGSFDAVKWSTVARKQQAITAFMQKPDPDANRDLEDADDDALSYDQIAAAASGDGDYLRKAELDAKVFKLGMMKRAHDSEALNRKQEIPRIHDRIAAMERRADKVAELAKAAKPIKEAEFSYKKPNGEVIEDKKEAAKNLVSNYLYSKDKKERTKIGEYKGYRVMDDGFGQAYVEVPIGRGEIEKIQFNVNTTEFAGTFQSLEKRISALASDADEKHIRGEVIPGLQSDLAKLQAVSDSPFPFTAQLEKALKQQEAVNKRLKAKEAESSEQGQPLHAGGTDVRAVAALGRKVRRGLREKALKSSDIPALLEAELLRIEAAAKDQAEVWKEFQRRKAEDFLAEHEDDPGLAGMAITAKSIAREQAAYDPELDSPVSRPMAARRREDVENSSEFKKWFGQSKVVDESGKPMPLYHGTQARNEIEAVDPARFLSGSHFGPGFYMAESPEIASQGYAEGHLHPRGQEVAGSPSVYKLYAKVENPLDMSKSAESKMIAAVFGSPSVDLEEMGFGSRPTNEVMYKQLAKRMGDDKGAVNQKLQEMGYDGITRLNRASEESPEHREWVVFQPNQVKSATGNRGTFDESANLSTARRAAAGPASQLANPMDVLLHAETLTKTRGTRGARMFVNDHARALLGASLTEVFGEDYSNVASINLSRDEVTKVAEYLEGEAANLTGDYQVGANRFVGELRDLLKQAKPSQRTFNIVDITPFEQRYQSGFRPDAERAVETFKSDVREESFHWSQREIGGTAIASVGSSWAQSSKGFGKYRRALLKLGYADDPEILAAETAAKIAAGKFDDLGIRTEADHQQADNWLASYFERIADKHGVEVLSQFDKLLPRASKAREQGVLSAKERINQRIAEESAKAGATANRPRAPGESGDGVRTGDQKARQEKSAESVPRRSADEPFESVPQADVKQAVLFDEKGLPRKSWGNMWANLGDVLNLPKALRASGDLSAAGRQGFFLSIPPSRWKLAAKAFGRGVASSEAMGLKKGAYQRLKQDLKAHPAYKEMVAAGWVPLTSDEGHLSAETELFGSRFAGKIPWAKYSEQAYKMNLDWLALSTFELYKKSIDKSVRDPKERFEGYQAAVDWINVSSGRGSYSGRFGQWYKEKPAPFLNVIGWAPGLVYSRFQILNPVTYAKNLKNPQSRVVFRKQMSELFQSAAVLFVTGALAKAAGALISTDPEEADFLKIRFGTTRYDVLAGLQQVARLSLRIGDYLRTKATTDTSTEEGQKKVRKASGEATTALLRFGRTKLGPVPGFVVDWWNDWTKVTGERHAPGEFIDSFTEGNKVKGFADLAEDPLVSQVIPLFWADLVAAYEFGWRSGGTEGGLKHIAKVLPAGLGLGVQDYERPEWSKETAKKLDKFDLDPKFPKREYKEKEVDYQKRVKAHIADEESVINRFTSDPNMANQPLARQKTLLQYEMSEDGRSRMRKLDPADIEDDRTVRAWIQVGVERLKNDPVYKAMPEEDQKRAVQSYYGRMNKYRAEPATKQRGYQRPEYVDNDILQQKIKAAIEAQK